jgi:hypothetical protein
MMATSSRSWGISSRGCHWWLRVPGLVGWMRMLLKIGPSLLRVFGITTPSRGTALKVLEVMISFHRGRLSLMLLENWHALSTTRWSAWSGRRWMMEAMIHRHWRRRRLLGRRGSPTMRPTRTTMVGMMILMVPAWWMVVVVLRRSSGRLHGSGGRVCPGCLGVC